MNELPAVRQRLDKWLWHARIVKSRTLAQKLIEAGSVRVNSARTTKPDARVGLDDVLTIGILNQVRTVRIAGVSDRRGPAKEAERLYEVLAFSGRAVD